MRSGPFIHFGVWLVGVFLPEELKKDVLHYQVNPKQLATERLKKYSKSPNSHISWWMELPPLVLSSV